MGDWDLKINVKVDLGELNKFPAKVLDTLANAGLILWEPINQRLLADADAYTAKRKVQSDIEVKQLKADAATEAAVRKAQAKAELEDLLGRREAQPGELEHRAWERSRKQEVRRQANLTSIFSKVLSIDPKNVNDDKPHPDWVQASTNICQDVSDEQMQVLWSNLIAGEIATPGRFSLLTLDAVRHLRKQEAELFTKLCSYVWVDRDERFPILEKQGAVFNADLTPVTNDQLYHLAAYNLVHAGRYNQDFKPHPDGRLRMRYFDKSFTIFVPTTYPYPNAINIGAGSLSTVGAELYDIAGATPDYDYMQIVLDDLRSHNIVVTEEE